MWQLIHGQSCNLMRQRLLSVKSNGYFINLAKSKPSQVIKRYISESQNSAEKRLKSTLLAYSPWKLCTGVSIGLAARLLLNNKSVLCKALGHSRVIQRKPNITEDSSKFDWNRFFRYLVPHKWLLLAAVASALAVAFLNVYIPAMLGVVVNVLASMKNNPAADFIEEIKMPAMKLISLYIGQAVFTFFYIHLLAQVGERVAAQMKQDLFVSILNQDMAFFDRERTGELVNRITVDVQDFKSSFKQTISGGLRAITQVVGSAVSLLIISPHLTGLTLVCIPSVVIGGTFIGSLLRKLSREAQAQIEKATLVAEEAIANIRTVRAFAGEENEARMFAEETNTAADLSMELGLGVGLFQAGTNLFLNGMVLATMFLGGHLMSTGQMSAGDVMAFLVNAQTVQRSVAQLSLLFGSVVKGISAGGRVFEYINMEPKMDTSGTKIIKYHEFHGDIEFKNVTFAYPTRPEAVVGSAVSLLIISPHLTGLTLVCIPSVVIGGTFIGSLLRKLSREAQAQIEKATLVAEEAIANIRTVRAFAGEENEARMFAEETNTAADLSMELGLGVGLFQAGTNLFLNGMVLATMFLGGHLMSTGQMSAGDVMAFLVNAQTVQRSVAQLSLLFGSVVKGISAGGRVFEYINMEPKMDTSGTKIIKYHEFHGDIEFKNVTFAYPTRPEAIVLKNFNLIIPAGKTVAIVGTSGNGKSTIAALLERFYDVNDGSVMIDGLDLRDMDCKWLRGRALGLISQEPVLFASSVRENIRYGKPEASDDEVYRAAMTANAHEFIVGFPDGYDTLVGERGMSLSGGQKQRIAIARAILKNPPIIILDEATSALDSASEKVVQTALETASKGRTVLVIAHRLSTVMNADLIVVLNKGKIAEMGTHEQLKRQKGVYWNLIKQQDQDTDDSKSL